MASPASLTFDNVSTSLNQERRSTAGSQRPNSLSFDNQQTISTIPISLPPTTGPAINDGHCHSNTRQYSHAPQRFALRKWINHKWTGRFSLFGGIQRRNAYNDSGEDDANNMALSCTVADDELTRLSPNRAAKIIDSGDPSNIEYLEQRAKLLKEHETAAPPSDAKTKPVDFTATLNAGEDDEIIIAGYQRSILRTVLCWVGFVLTLGLMRLAMHWRRHWLLIATHTPCGLDVAEMVLVREYFEGKHTVHYVKRVFTVNAENFQKYQQKPSKKNAFTPFKGIEYFSEMAEKLFQLSVHWSGGVFKRTDSLRLFKCKQLRYVWDDQSSAFVKLRGLDENVPATMIHQQKGLDRYTQRSRQLVYGLNEIYIPLKSVIDILFLEALNPFYVFQIFSVILWCTYSYYYYAMVIVFMSVAGIAMSIVQTRKNQFALYKTVVHSDSAVVVRADGTAENIDTKYLVPGDIVEIPSNGCTMQCDAVLLSGNCILDESMLTGESVPITKTPLPCIRDLIFDTKEHSRHVLFCGTRVIQTRYIGTEKVLACVINTGNITAKGGLVRSILYPPPVDYKLEQDSYKLILFLSVLAIGMAIYTFISKVHRNISLVDSIVESLDLITIAVPPALPAAMAVGRYYAQKRLEKNNIFCISPRSITISGSINCVCFDKTGTLTEDGLDMWGIIPTTTTNVFQMPLRQVERLPYDHLLFGMVTCHSITIMNGELKGDPLDLKMFESTGWQLEEANVSDDTKYDLLFPTHVRPPKAQRPQKISNSRDSIMDSINEKSASNTDLNSEIDIGIVREFSFTSSLQRMSVITRKLMDTHFNVYCKGSPEMILTLCKPETIPLDFHATLDVYAQQGYRIIAVAYKMLSKKMSYAKIQRISRERIECDLTFLGFVVLENRLKPDTIGIINSLMAANIRTVMVTGDNILTALSVAKDCDMIPTGQSVIIVTAKPKPLHVNEYELVYNLSGPAPNNNQINGSVATTPASINDVKPKTNGFVVSERGENAGNGASYVRMTDNNSIASIETIDTCTQLTQITHRDIELGNANDDDNNDHSSADSYDDDNSVTLAPELPNNNYRFAMTGKTWTVIRDYFPELLPRFVTRGTVFARMSPDQKQFLVLELQDMGYYVAMCGDGANDCGALKAAHTGISLSEAESSVASPFTSKNPTIACVPNVIREGRCALVTSVAIFKFMAAYSLVQFTSVVMLYSIATNLTDYEFLYIDLFMITIFAFFFGRFQPYVGPLVKRAPLNALLSLLPVASLTLHLLLAIGFQVFVWFYLRQQSWFTPYEYDEDSKACYESYSIFILSCFQYITLAIVFSKGAPYRRSIFSNHGFLCSLVINTIIVIVLAVWANQTIIQSMEIIYPPDVTYRYTIVALGILNFVLSLIVEMVIIDNLLFRKLRYRFHNLEKSHKKYLAVENYLRQEPAWPPISQFNNDLGSNSGSVLTPTSGAATISGAICSDSDHQSPKSFTEICVESDFVTPLNNCNSVLKGFFDNVDIDSDLNDASSSDDDDADEQIEQNKQNNRTQTPTIDATDTVFEQNTNVASVSVPVTTASTHSVDSQVNHSILPISKVKLVSENDSGNATSTSPNQLSSDNIVNNGINALSNGGTVINSQNEYELNEILATSKS